MKNILIEINYCLINNGSEIGFFDIENCMQLITNVVEQLNNNIINTTAESLSLDNLSIENIIKEITDNINDNLFDLLSTNEIKNIYICFPDCLLL